MALKTPPTVAEELAQYIESITDLYSPVVTRLSGDIYDNKYELDFGLFEIRGELRNTHIVEPVEGGVATVEKTVFRADQLVVKRPFPLWNKYIRFRNHINCDGAVVKAIEHRQKRAADSMQAEWDARDKASLEALKALVLQLEKSY